jgi:predicted RNase H-like HicB family nuclease
MKKSFFTVYIEKDEDGIFVGSVPSVPGCHAQGKTQEEMIKNLREVLSLCLRNIDKSAIEKTHFVGIQNVSLKNA